MPTADVSGQMLAMNVIYMCLLKIGRCHEQNF